MRFTTANGSTNFNFCITAAPYVEWCGQTNNPNPHPFHHKDSRKGNNIPPPGVGLRLAERSVELASVRIA
jgi:hypothetical protein